MLPTESTPLENIPGWPKDVANKLKESWITTAEQFVAAISTPGGFESLMQHMGTSKEETTHLLALAKAELSPEVAKRMSTPIEPGQFGLGALDPDQMNE